MPNNILITGPPRSGKTTVVQSVADRLEGDGYRVGGIYCPERRSDSERVGFDIVDAMTGDSEVLAHVDREVGPAIGKYRVDVDAVDEICATAFPRAFEQADVLVVDEIAPMEVHSDEFTRQVRRALDGDVPLLAAIQYSSASGFIGEVKQRDDVDLFEVTAETRDELPETLTETVHDWL